jgi:hypothetical protein
MFLLWSSLLRTSGFLDVDDKFLLSLLFVDGSGWKVNLVPTIIESILA